MKPWLVIPCYDHGVALAGVVASLARYDLPAVVVDDGSGPETRAILAELAAAQPWLTVHRHPENRGKGAAVVTGCRLAADAGATHALQLDADGQHDAADVPRFLDAMAKHPDALVLGVPVFDASVPKSRLYAPPDLARARLALHALLRRAATRSAASAASRSRPRSVCSTASASASAWSSTPSSSCGSYWEGIEIVSLPTARALPGGRALALRRRLGRPAARRGSTCGSPAGTALRAPRLLARRR